MFIIEKTVTNLKKVLEIIPNLHYEGLASLLHATADAIRQETSLGDALEELGVDVEGITDYSYGLRHDVQDIYSEKELIAIASACTAHLMKAYGCGC
ncbi:MAG: hypothetical protein KME46_33610 [Brasilonema angustatum HA4187-MV1]|jgi:hypothetical protein|nr:hypothetical protein [Brasilonema angustatum HA4187-MV1]